MPGVRFIRQKIKRVKKGRAYVCWSVALILAPLLPWWLLTSVIIPDFWDTQYVMKFDGLKAFAQQSQGHPLWVVFGSSRVDHGFQPGVLAARTSQPGAPAIFNFGQGGSDLFRQFISLRRVIKDGIKPDRVGIEIMGVQLGGKDELFANEKSLLIRARRDELPDYYKYSLHPDETRATWRDSRLMPTLKYGTDVPVQAIYLKFPWLPFIKRFATPPPYDKWGWHVTPGYTELPPGEQDKVNEDAKKNYRGFFIGGFSIQNLQVEILNRILKLCRDEKINVFLVRMPESKTFEEVYTPESNKLIDAFINNFAKENGLQYIDAREWIDSKGFYDGHHMNADGGAEFSRRMGDALLAPASH